MKVVANAPGLLPPAAEPKESAPSLPPAPRAEVVEDAEERMRGLLEERALGPVQAKSAIHTGYGDLIAAARAPDATGTPAPVRAKMEGALGADFSDVRVHTGSARAVELGALAFTQGSDIHVAPGHWAPETPKGQELLGHELGHVLQQRAGRVKATAQLKGVGLNDDRALEAEADAMGAKAARGEAAQPRTPFAPMYSPTAIVQRTIGKDNKTRLNTLTTVNTALGGLSPVVAAIALADFTDGAAASAGMLNAVIAADNNVLYDSITQADVIAFYNADLTTAVDTQAPTYAYDSHGDKHFAGGPAGTKFTAGKAVVNPLIEAMITAQIGRIRRDAAGANTLYYYTAPALTQCPGGHILTIQLDYTPSTDTIGYHGYPDRFTGAQTLSRSKGGTAI